MTAHVEVRSQHSVDSSNGQFSGPNAYVVVQGVPAQSRGIRIIYCGEGYKEHQGPRSVLDQAIAKAEKMVEKYEE